MEGWMPRNVSSDEEAQLIPEMFQALAARTNGDAALTSPNGTTDEHSPVNANSPYANLQSGRDHLHNGEYQQAIVEFSRALTRKATRAEALAGRGEARRLLGDSIAALTDLDEAHRLLPSDPR